MRRSSVRRTGQRPSSPCWQNAASGQIAWIPPEYQIRMPSFLPRSSPPAAQAIPRQRIPADDIDDLLAQLTVTSIGEDAIQQIEQATISLAESHTQAPARKLLSQVMPLASARPVAAWRKAPALTATRTVQDRIPAAVARLPAAGGPQRERSCRAVRDGGACLCAGSGVGSGCGHDGAREDIPLAEATHRIDEYGAQGVCVQPGRPDPGAARQPGSERRSAPGRRRTCAGGSRQSRAGSGVRDARLRAFGLVVPCHPASGLRAVRGDAARRCGRDAAGCLGGRCCVVGGSAEGSGELGTDTRRRGNRASAEWVA